MSPLPSFNFNYFESDDSNLNSLMKFKEKKQFHLRHNLTNLLYDKITGTVSRFAPSKSQETLIVMPNDYIGISENSGYFVWDNIVAFVVSRYKLLASQFESDLYSVTSLNSKNTVLVEFCIKKLRLLKFLQIEVESNCVKATDKYFNVIIGSLSNNYLR